MQTTNYKLSKTGQKTAIENKLIFHKNDIGNTYLFDFSLLDVMVLSDIEKNLIKESSIKSVSACNKLDFYGCVIDNFTACDGKALYNMHKVYSNKTWKRVYCIMELSKVEHNTLSRKSVYDNYSNINQVTTGGTCEPFSDLEI